VLAHVVDADIHQLDRIERRAAEMRRGGGMRGAAGELKSSVDVGERDGGRDAAKGGRMPGNRDIDIVEGAGPTMKALPAPPSSAGQP
jgi:hypothetical protein